MLERKYRVLVVDDEPRYVRAIQVNLQASGYEVVTAQDGVSAVERAASAEPDLILLDVRMPGMDGFAACHAIREFSRAPIIMLTALAESADKVKGLDSGADDYITKPFSADELLARVRAVLRRAEFSAGPATPSVFEMEGLRVDLTGQRVFVDGDEVSLTPTEYRLLSELARQAGQVLIPSYLLEKVWGSSCEGDEHLVWQAIHRLRKKIEKDPGKPRYIQTRPGIGYLLGPD